MAKKKEEVNKALHPEAAEPPEGANTQLTDAWLLDIVDDPEIDRALSELTVEDAVRDLGMTVEDARKAFMPPEPEPDIEVEDLYQMTSDILAGKTEPHIKTAKGWDAWESLKEDIEDIKKRGGVVDLPAL